MKKLNSKGLAAPSGTGVIRGRGIWHRQSSASVWQQSTQSSHWIRSMPGRILLICFFLSFGTGACEREMNLYVGDFQSGRLEGWETKVFNGETQYRIVERKGRKVLEGISIAAASGLIKTIEVDIERYPYFNWSWMATRLMIDNDEMVKKGDDFPARIFILIAGDVLFGNPRALNYVWSRNKPVGSSWPNPFTENATMLVVESGDALLNQWISYKRNVREDLKRYLEVDASTTLAVALMVDTDNTGQEARSYFGDIFFSSK